MRALPLSNATGYQKPHALKGVDRGIRTPAQKTAALTRRLRPLGHIDMIPYLEDVCSIIYIVLGVPTKNTAIDSDEI